MVFEIVTQAESRAQWVTPLCFLNKKELFSFL